MRHCPICDSEIGNPNESPYGIIKCHNNHYTEAFFSWHWEAYINKAFAVSFSLRGGGNQAKQELYDRLVAGAKFEWDNRPTLVVYKDPTQGFFASSKLVLEKWEH